MALWTDGAYEKYISWLSANIKPRETTGRVRFGGPSSTRYTISQSHPRYFTFKMLVASTTLLYSLSLFGLASQAAASPASLTSRAAATGGIDLETCDCGYVDAADPAQTVYSTYYRMDFTNTDWTKTELSKQFRLSNSTIYKSVSAPYARDFSPDQVQISSDGLSLVVSPPESLTNGSSVPCGGIYSKTNDFGFGSYHLTGKVAAQEGVVNAFFVYKNDTSEVDMEYVSRDESDQQFVRETVKPQIYDDNGAASPLTYQRDFHTDDDESISANFHEWAFKWTEDDVTFAIDGNYTNKLSRNIPQDRGLFAISAWSDGGAGYSQGPPSSNATFLISQVWILYNSTASPAPVASLNGQAAKSSAMTCSARKSPCYVRAPSGNNNGLQSSFSGAATSGASSLLSTLSLSGMIAGASLFFGAVLAL